MRYRVNPFKLGALIALAALAVVSVIAVFRFTAPTSAPTPTPTATAVPTATPVRTLPPTATPVPTEAPKDTLSIMSLGDILFQAEQLMAAKQDDGTYDFSQSLAYVKELIGSADLVIGNFEGVAAGENAGYDDPMVYNIPDAALDALAATGVDVLTLANNQIFSMGKEAAERTEQMILSRGMQCAGIMTAQGAKPYVLTTVKNIPVAVLAFSYDYGADSSVPAWMYTKYASENICAYIRQAKTDGAKLVIVQMHWGDEFSDTTLYAQKVLAQDMLDTGADMIFGCHAHIIQEIQRKKVDDGREVFVCYGQGNFLSSQRADGRDYGIVARAEYGIDENGRVKLRSTGYIPVWVQQNDVNDNPVYRVLPVGIYAKSETRDPILSPNCYDRVRAVWQEVRAQIGEEKAECLDGGIQ